MARGGELVYFGVHATLAVLTGLTLWSYRRELFRTANLLDRWRGRLRRGRRLDPGIIHHDFAKRRPELATLLVFVRNGCEYCDRGLEALHAAIPRDAVNICIAYAIEDGEPEWSPAVPSRSIIAGVDQQTYNSLPVNMVPRWIWINPKGIVVADLAGFTTELTLGLLLGGFASATRRAGLPLRRRGGQGTSHRKGVSV